MLIFKSHSSEIKIQSSQSLFQCLIKRITFNSPVGYGVIEQGI